MKRKKLRLCKKICMRICVILAVAMSVHMAVERVTEERKKQEAEEQHQQEIINGIQNAASLDDICAGIEKIFQDVDIERLNAEEIVDAFSAKSAEYIGADGFCYYEIPEEYQRAGGNLPEEIQIYTYCLCKQEGVSYALILAMIEQESGYKYDCIGDDGESVGYMQIMQRWHEDRMKKLEVTDLFNPYQNIHLGIDIMKELIGRYGTIQDALAVYNYGATGAKEHLWSKEIYVYDYNESIISRMKEIERELSNGI